MQVRGISTEMSKCSNLALRRNATEQVRRVHMGVLVVCAVLHLQMIFKLNVGDRHLKNRT